MPQTCTRAGSYMWKFSYLNESDHVVWFLYQTFKTCSNILSYPVRIPNGNDNWHVCARYKLYIYFLCSRHRTKPIVFPTDAYVVDLAWRT